VFYKIGTCQKFVNTTQKLLHTKEILALLAVGLEGPGSNLVAINNFLQILSLSANKSDCNI
jgi:hypothetical protein